MKYKGFILATLLCFSLLSACSSKENPGEHVNDSEIPNQVANPGEIEQPKDPFSLLIYAAGVSADEFDRRFRGSLEKKFPHITFQYNAGGADNAITDLVAAGQIPDIMRVLNSQLHTQYLDLGLGYSLDDLVKKHNYNTKRFEPIFIDSLIDAGKTSELYGLPVPPYFVRVLYYNKELFDKFGVEPPVDGMTWDEAYALADQMSRKDGDVLYRGFSLSISTVPAYNEFSLPVLDLEKDELAGSDIWKRILDTYVRFYRLPNNPIAGSLSTESNVFKDGNIAMSVNVFSPYVEFGDVDWDMVSIPLIEGAPQQSGFFTPGNWMITQQSKHKDDAFQVIMEMLSDELQLADSRNGITTTLADAQIKNELGKDHPVISQKNLNAVHYHQLAPLPPERGPGMITVPIPTQRSLMNEAIYKAAQGIVDVNTALREVDEQLRQELEKERSK